MLHSTLLSSLSTHRFPSLEHLAHGLWSEQEDFAFLQEAQALRARFPLSLRPLLLLMDTQTTAVALPGTASVGRHRTAAVPIDRHRNVTVVSLSTVGAGVYIELQVVVSQQIENAAVCIILVVGALAAEGKSPWDFMNQSNSCAYVFARACVRAK